MTQVNRSIGTVIVLTALVQGLGACASGLSPNAAASSVTASTDLPAPALSSELSLEEALASRRSVREYGDQRGARYVHLEAGHAAQNLLLQATAMGLGTVPIGAFNDQDVQQALGLLADHQPLYLIPVGRIP